MKLTTYHMMVICYVSTLLYIPLGLAQTTDVTPSIEKNGANQKTVLPEVIAPQVEMKCAPNPVAVAQPLTCTVSITHSEQITVKVQPANGAESGEATLPVQLKDGQLKTTRTFTVRSLDLNKPVRVKGVSVAWDAIGGQKGVVSVAAQKIPIKSMITGVSNPQARTFTNPFGLDTEQTKEKLSKAQARFWATHGPIPFEEFNWPLVMILAMIVVAAVALLIGWVIGRLMEARRRARMPVIDTRPAHVIAWGDLEHLKQSDLIAQEKFKIYYQRLSEIIRSYIGKRYQQSVGIEMTSDEVREVVKLVKIEADALMCLEDFLSDTDLVKFADVSPSIQSVESMTELAYRVIDLTKEEDQSTEDQSTEDQNTEDQNTSSFEIKAKEEHSL